MPLVSEVIAQLVWGIPCMELGNMVHLLSTQLKCKNSKLFATVGTAFQRTNLAISILPCSSPVEVLHYQCSLGKIGPRQRRGPWPRVKLACTSGWFTAGHGASGCLRCGSGESGILFVQSHRGLSFLHERFHSKLT